MRSSVAATTELAARGLPSICCGDRAGGGPTHQFLVGSEKNAQIATSDAALVERVRARPFCACRGACSMLPRRVRPPPTATKACAVPGTSWSEACTSQITALAESSDIWQPTPGQAIVALRNASKAELDMIASRVVNVLHARGVLCSVVGTQDRCQASFHKSTRSGQQVLQVCLPRMQRVFCAPFASDRSTSPKVRRLASGCAAPTLPCQRFDLGRIALDLARLRTPQSEASGSMPSSPQPPSLSSTPAGQHRRSRGPFFGPDDVNEAYTRLRRRNKSLPLLEAVLRPMRPPMAPIHGRCALVGSNHVLRCREWGALFNGSDYDAIFRVNGFMLDRQRVPNQWLDPRHAGTRTTYRQSCLTAGERLASSRSEVCLLTPDFLSTQRDHTDHTQVCGGPKLRSEYTERSVAAATAMGYEFLLFGRDAPYKALAGEGSGDAAFLAALALCNEVHAYGVGLLGRSRRGARGEVVMEAVYQHSYDPILGRCEAHASNTSCGDQAAYVTNQLLREVQWAVWHTLGIARWVWA